MNLHPQLQQDCKVVAKLRLCHVLLMCDANYPWFILVPDRDNVTEIFHLSRADQQQLIHESSYLAKSMAQAFAADKINVAALGNVVPQLHIHHIARYRHDPAWPAPVWGAVPTKAYSNEKLMEVVNRLKPVFVDEVTHLI